MIVAKDLPTRLYDPPVGQRHGLDPPSGSVSGFKHKHLGTRLRQIARRGQPGKPRAQNGDVDQVP